MSDISQLTDAERQQQLELLRASAAAFAAKESPLPRARALRGNPPGFDPGFWNALVQQGWTGLLVPESAGGFGQGFAEMAEVVTALASQVAPEPVTPVLVFAGGILKRCAEQPTARRLLGELAEGRTLPAVAWQEDVTGQASLDAGGGLADPASSCSAGASGITLRGTKRHVRPGASASGYIVSASASDGPALVWVPAETRGVTAQLQRLADGGFAARLDFDVASLPAEHLLCRGERARAVLAGAYDEALVLAGAELLAVSRRMVAMTLDYLRTRKQFGKAIGSFQALQHRAVDMLIQQELCGAVVAQALADLDRGCDGALRARLAARVKARCSEAALAIARESVQMHGAIGVTDENDLGLYLQRALVLSAWLGNGGSQRRRFAALTRADAMTEEATA
jgi:alkylation response protein AidB-like acyl-CoA dehydrogenase